LTFTTFEQIQERKVLLRHIGTKNRFSDTQTIQIALINEDWIRLNN